jgi:O-acetyl-ADP-ribose deacetylase (regulator of RNase III)
MSDLIRIEGDLLALAEAGKFDIIVHGCNCFNTMGLGLARAIRLLYPEAYAADAKTKSGDKNKLGQYTHAKTAFGFTVINAYTQYGVATSTEDVFEYGWFETFLTNLFIDIETNNVPVNIGFPYLGCGLAGGDEERIITLLEEFAFDLSLSDTPATVTLVKYKD